MPIVFRRRHARRIGLAAVLFGVACAVAIVVFTYFQDGPGSPGAHDPVTASHCGVSGWLTGIRETLGRPRHTLSSTTQDIICNGRGPKTVAEDWQAYPCGVLELHQASAAAGYVVVAGNPSKATCRYSAADRASQFVVRISADGGDAAFASATATLARSGAVRSISGLGDRAAGGAGVVVQAGTTVLRIADTVRGTPATPTQAVPIMQALLAKRCVPVGPLLTPDCA